MYVTNQNIMITWKHNSYEHKTFRDSRFILRISKLDFSKSGEAAEVSPSLGYNLTKTRQIIAYLPP